MIYGIGTDIVELSRVQETYNRFGDHFVNRLLMDEERELFAKNKWPVRFLAMRFAAKEATVKAMGTASFRLSTVSRMSLGTTTRLRRRIGR